MGTIAFLMDIVVEELSKLKWNTTQAVLLTDVILGWLVYMSFSIAFVLVVSTSIIFIAPATQGSGVAEAMGYLNGV